MDSLAELDDAALITGMAGWAAVESAASARRLAMIAEFTTRRMGSAAHADWVCDDWDAASVEVGAALNAGPGRASGQMTLASTLRTRLPKVAALLADGTICTRTVAMIARRSDRVHDPEALAALDAALAERAVAWGPISDRKLEQAIDLWVTAVDQNAVRRTRSTVRDRDFSIGDPGDHDGITTVWGRLLATDAKLLGARLTAMARAVCDADPRTLAQRRADALGALGASSAHLSCACGAPACPAAAQDGRAASVVIHILAHAETLDAAPDPACHGPDHPDVTAELRQPPSPPQATDTWPEMPDGVQDRAADVWEPLIAVAELVGGHWQTTARVAAVTVVIEAKSATPSIGVLLLRDLRTVFNQLEIRNSVTDQLITNLKGIEDSPWAVIRKGEPLDARGLAHRLRKYGIEPKPIRDADRVFKGYTRPVRGRVEPLPGTPRTGCHGISYIGYTRHTLGARTGRRHTMTTLLEDIAPRRDRPRMGMESLIKRPPRRAAVLILIFGPVSSPAAGEDGNSSST